MSKVKITANKDGNVIIVSTDDPKYGYVRVEQERSWVDEQSWQRTKVVSALIHGEVKDLEKAGYTVGQELPGKIIFKDSLTPFDKKTPDRHLKIAGETTIVCRVDGKPIYRKNFYNGNPNSVDVEIPHDNGAEIAAANAKLKASKEGKGENFQL